MCLKSKKWLVLVLYLCHKCWFPCFPASSAHWAELWSGPISAQPFTIDLIVCFRDPMHTSQAVMVNPSSAGFVFCIVSSGWHIDNPQTLTPLQMCLCERQFPFVHAHTYKQKAIFTVHFQTFPPPWFVTLELRWKKKNVTEREKCFNGSLYAISNGLCFISHSDDFRPYNGAVPYLVYDQWQYISVLSFGTSLLRLLVLAVDFSAVQFEQQRFLLQSFVVFFFCLITEVHLCISLRSQSSTWKRHNEENWDELASSS